MPEVPQLDLPIRFVKPAAGSVMTHGRSEFCPSGSVEEPLTANPLRFVILVSSVTASPGNGHQTASELLVRALTVRGHEVLCLQRSAARPVGNRGTTTPPAGRLSSYANLKELKERYTAAIRNADVVIVESNVLDGALIGEWVSRRTQGVMAFYDLDTPMTVSRLASGDLDYLSRKLVGRYDIYLSLLGGPFLNRIENLYGARMARPLYCSVDPRKFYPEASEKKWDLGYLGTYGEGYQPALDELLLGAARNWSDGRFVVAGQGYPHSTRWPKNVKRCGYTPSGKQRAFYNSQRFALNVTRADEAEMGYSPAVRLFEAAACGTPIISDWWDGLDSFLEPNQEILISADCEESLYYLLSISETERQQIGARARARILAAHTSRHRALELENYVLDVLKRG